MTRNAPVSISSIFSGRIFWLIFETFLLQYWDPTNSNIYNEHDSFFKRLETFSNLDSNWKYNRWNIDDLDKTCSKIDEGLQELNPNLFFGKELGYIDQIKSWYLLEYVCS